MHPSYDGCREPAQNYNGLSCNKCVCNPNDRSCKVLSASPHGNQKTYGVRHLIYDQDTSHLPVCALCLKEDERMLMSLKKPSHCDFRKCPDKIEFEDQCFSPNSCDCFCFRAVNLLDECPDVKPQWLE